MEFYFWIKLIHILSATILFGTGIGTAFFMLMGFLSKDRTIQYYIAKTVVLADWLFTTPAVLVQFFTGLYMVNKLNISYHSLWFVCVLAGYFILALVWIPVVFIQIKIAKDLKNKVYYDLDVLYKAWIALGCFGFLVILIIFYLMVFKPFL